MNSKTNCKVLDIMALVRNSWGGGRTSAILLLLLNLIANCSYLYTQLELIALIAMICLSAALASFETIIFYLLRSFKALQKIYLCSIIAIYNLLIAVDYFCLFNFQTTLNQDKIDIIRETHKQEVIEFLHTYISAELVALVVVGIVLFNIILVYVSKRLANLPHLGKLYISLSVMGFVVWGAMVVSYIKYHNGFSIPQYTAFTRIAYSYKVSLQRSAAIKNLYGICRNIIVQQTFKDKPNVIVVIGESSSVYHSQLYGYNKTTTPQLQQLKDKGELFAFDDVVSVDDHTHGVMESVFSLDSMHTAFDRTPLFPAVYKCGKYKTVCYDTQYMIGGVNFLSDEILSNIMFDKRNQHAYPYDHLMVKDIKLEDKPTLYVIHLWGQHYTYTQRYPKNWQHFSPNEYPQDRWNEKQRTLIAQYDDATRYNDAVLKLIIDKFKNTNSILIHFSDHGEEVFELRNYNGHGNAALSPNLKYQIRVPLLIWMSEKYKKQHPAIDKQIKNNIHTPIITDDVSHTILSLGGMHTKWYKSSRDFLHPHYTKNKHRMVLNTIDYDTYQPQ